MRDRGGETAGPTARSAMLRWVTPTKNP